MTKNSVLLLIMLMVLSSLVLYSQASDTSDTTDTSDTYTLEDTINRVLQNNPAVAEATDAIGIAAAKVGESRSKLYPAIKGEATYNRIGPAPHLTVPDFGTFQLFPNDNYDIHIATRYLLYDFNRTRETVHLAQTQIASVTDRLETLKRDLAFQATQIFYTILFLEENIKVQDEHIRILNEHLSTSQKKLESGTATELDVLTTQVRLTSAQSQAVELQSNLEKQKIIIRKLMGLPTDVVIILKGEFVLKNLELDVPQLLKKALNDRIEIKTVNDALETAKVQDTLAHLAKKPSLNINLVGGVKDGYFPNLTRPYLNFAAGVAFEMPIFDGYYSKNLQAEAAANIKMLEDRMRDVKEMVKAEVLQALEDVQANKKKYDMLDINKKMAAKSVDFAQVRYTAGTVTNLDLLVSEETRTDAEYLRLQALYRYVLSVYTLQRAIGSE